MVEKIVIQPDEVRGLGNIVSVKDDTDFSGFAGLVNEVSDSVYGVTSDVFQLNSTLLFSDGGITTNNKLNYWYWNTNYGTGSVSDDGTTFNATTTSYLTVSATLTSPATSSIYIYDFPLIIEFDIVNYEDPTGVSDYSRIRVYNNANNKNAYWNIKDYGVGHYTIVCRDGSQKMYYNGVEQSRSFTFTPTSGWNVAFQTKGHIKFKNFVIYSNSDHQYSLSFSEDNYYTLTGSATLAATLTDNGNLLSGATVTFESDLGDPVEKITNSSGVASLTVSTGDRAFYRASCKDQDDTANVQKCLIYDYGRTDNYNDIWSGKSPLPITREADGTRVYYDNTSSTTKQIYFSSRIDINNKPAAIDLDLFECDYCRLQFGRYSTGSSNYYKAITFNADGLVHIEFKSDVTEIYQNGDLVSTDAGSTNFEQISLFFIFYANTTTNAKYKNLNVYYI